MNSQEWRISISKDLGICKQKIQKYAAGFTSKLHKLHNFQKKYYLQQFLRFRTPKFSSQQYFDLPTN